MSVHSLVVFRVDNARWLGDKGKRLSSLAISMFRLPNLHSLERQSTWLGYVVCGASCQVPPITCLRLWKCNCSSILKGLLVRYSRCHTATWGSDLLTIHCLSIVFITSLLTIHHVYGNTSPTTSIRTSRCQHDPVQSGQLAGHGSSGQVDATPSSPGERLGNSDDQLDVVPLLHDCCAMRD